DGNTDQQANDNKQVITVCGACDSKYVIQAHDRIRDQNCRDGSPYRTLRFHLMIFLVVYQQLVRDPDKQQSPSEQQPRKLQKPGNSDRSRTANENGAERTDDNNGALHFLRDIAGGKADNDGVVSGEHEVNDDNVE